MRLVIFLSAIIIASRISPFDMVEVVLIIIGVIACLWMDVEEKKS